MHKLLPQFYSIVCPLFRPSKLLLIWTKMLLTCLACDLWAHPHKCWLLKKTEWTKLPSSLSLNLQKLPLLKKIPLLSHNFWGRSLSHSTVDFSLSGVLCLHFYTVRVQYLPQTSTFRFLESMFYPICDMALLGTKREGERNKSPKLWSNKV